MKTILVLLTILLLSSPCIEAQRKQSTTRRNLRVERQLKPALQRDTTECVILTVADDDTTYRLSGFDKPLNSGYETMFLTNKSDNSLIGIFFTIEYLDRTGRQLNKVSKSIRTDIPAGETRQLRWNSWDRQQSFFYIGSRHPRSRATGFDVKCRVDSVEIKREK